MKIRISKRNKKSLHIAGKNSTQNGNTKRKVKRYGKVPKPNPDDPPTKNH